MASIRGVNIKVPATGGEAIVSGHYMVAFQPQIDLERYVGELKTICGINVVQMFFDFYISDFLDFMDACYAQNLPVIPCTYPLKNEELQDLFDNTWDHPALYRDPETGKRVYAGYFYTGDYNGVFPVPAGYSKNDFLYWVSPQYSTLEDVWKPFYKSYPASAAAITRILAVDGANVMDGIFNFGVGKADISGNNYDRVRNENIWLGHYANQLSKTGIASVSGTYASVGMFNEGFARTLDLVKDQLSLSLPNRAKGLWYVTLNDVVEHSGHGPVMRPTTDNDGLSFWSGLGNSFTGGGGLPFPALDKTGIALFLKPWVNAFKAKKNLADVVITQEAIFFWYTLHPVDVGYPETVTVPAFIVANMPETVNGVARNIWWRRTMYTHPDLRVEGESPNDLLAADARIAMILNEALPDHDDIRMAAHLMAPAKLGIKINGVMHVSPTITTKDGYYQIPQEIGTPEFYILELDGVTVRQYSIGAQPITNSNWPGGHQQLIMKGVLL